MQKSDSQKEPLPPSIRSQMQPWPARTGHPMPLANALVGSGIVVMLLVVLPLVWHDSSKRFSCLCSLAVLALLTSWKWIQFVRWKSF